ncbi:MAG: DNA polymerase IV [Kiritimatiellae bacterium]|nr:DNA polymerase IV [Kiritimatiellia bacterium]
MLHVDMDAFFASVEIRDRPELRGKPVIIGSKPTERGVVSTASYEARRYGVHSAMPSSEAGRLCPHGIFLPPDMPKYAAVSRRIFDIFGRYTPLVEGVSVDEAFLDVTGAGRLFGPPEEIGRKIKADILREEQLTCSVGVAANKYLAKLGSEYRKPDGLTVVPFDPDAAAAWLRPLPIGSVWGIGKVTREAFLRAGVRTVGDLQDLPEPALRAVVGPNMADHFLNLAFGRDDRPVETEWLEKSISREHTFPFDERTPETIENCLFSLVEDVAARLRADGRLAGTAKLKVRWGAGAFETLTRQRPLDPPTRLGRDLHAAARALWAGVGLRHPVRLIGFGVTQLDVPALRQLSLFGDDDTPRRDRQERAERAADAIRSAHGPDSLRPAREL